MTTYHLDALNTKKAMTYVNGNQGCGLGQTLKKLIRKWIYIVHVFRLKKKQFTNHNTVIKLYYEIYILTAPCKYMYKSGNSFELHTTALSVRRKS
jgi:hypothetical protein